MNNKNSSTFDKFLENERLLSLKEAAKHNNKLSITQEYDRKIYDDVSGHRKFKKEFFGNRKSKTDYITGNTLHSDVQAAKNKYGMKKYVKHTADVDHIIPLKRIHKTQKHNPFLTDADIKIIGKSKYNYQVISSAINRQKADDTNLEFALNPQKKINIAAREKMLGDHAIATAGTTLEATYLTSKNVVSEFNKGALNTLEASAIPVMIEGVYNLYLVANKEKSMKEATKDMGKITANVAMLGGGQQVLVTGINNTLKNSGHVFLKSIANSNIVPQLIIVTFILKDATLRYINGEINGEKFFKEIGEKGVFLMTSMIGGIIGQSLIPIPLVGFFIGSWIVSTACMSIYSTLKSLNYHKEKLARVNALVNDALNEIQRQRDFLKTMLAEEYEKWDTQITLGFEELFTATSNNDVNGIAQGLDRMLNLFNASVKFKTFDEFDKFFMNENAVLRL